MIPNKINLQKKIPAQITDFVNRENKRIIQLASQESDERTLLTYSDCQWGRVNPTEYHTGILSLSGMPYGTQQVLREQHMDQRDFLLGTTTASSILMDDAARLHYTYRFLDNMENIPQENRKLRIKYLINVQNHIRRDIARFLHVGSENELSHESKRILFDHSGTHSALSIHMLFPESPVIMTTEVGRSLKVAFSGRHPFSHDIHGNVVMKDAPVLGTAGKVYEIPIRESKDGTARSEESIRNEYIQAIKSEMRQGKKTIIVAIPLPPKTGLNPQSRITWMKELRNKETLMQWLNITDKTLLPEIIVLADMAQTRFIYDKDKDGNLTDPTRPYEEGGICDIALFASGKAMAGMPLGSILLMSRNLADYAEGAFRNIASDYTRHYSSIGQISTLWNEDNIDNISEELLHTSTALTARLLSTGDMLKHMNALGVENAQKNFREIHTMWDSIIAKKKGLSKLYRDVSDENTPSIISFQLESLNKQSCSYEMAKKFRQMLLTPFDDNCLNGLRDWNMTEKEKDAMRLLFELGFPVVESIPDITIDKHDPIMRIGISWLQAIDWSHRDFLRPEKSRRRQIVHALDYLATKIEVLASHMDSLSRLEPFSSNTLLPVA